MTKINSLSHSHFRAMTSNNPICIKIKHISNSVIRYRGSQSEKPTYLNFSQRCGYYSASGDGCGYRDVGGTQGETFTELWLQNVCSTVN